MTQVQQLAVASGDFYQFTDGSRRMRVSRVLDALSKDQLEPWSARLAAEYAVLKHDEWKDLPADEAVALVKQASDRYRDATADLGTLVHDCIEQTALGLPVDPAAAHVARGHLKQWELFTAAFSPHIVATEVLVWSERHGYAGRLDNLMEIDLGDGQGKRLVIGDIKTGKAVRTGTALQLAAYRYADWAEINGRKVKMPEVTGAVVIHVRPRSWGLYPMASSPAVFSRFRMCLDARRWLDVESETVIGERLCAPGLTHAANRAAA